ncbi:hypothetical protein [Pontivivens insulae]|uniref:Monocarboxylate 2-oxoacid-binding periplasmic protein n=1 Tax=Pontivivens insulae TaxID=1639689 RepID=A0A2R8AER7_9RHOB|nr:hypothetical protein [Pontivivens insulae]RED11930.1 TRAP-type mannitol/chloroaromatic compound transport system substrate-binding protein [Pontivivens insulae]SPF30686.1 Monocarboxylate 2-oxoacid-binding periplasmic protein [Pontivivens insulae]
MDRRGFLVAGAGVGGMALAAPAVAQGTQQLTAAVAFGDGDARANMAARMAERVSALTNGALTLDIQALPGGDLNAALNDGSIGCVAGNEDLWFDLDPAFGLFCSVPGGMMERELEAWIRSDTGQERWDALSAEYGMKSLLIGDSGGEMLWSGEALDSADALSGKTVSASGLARQVYSALGAAVEAASLSGPFAGGADIYETGPLAAQYQSRDNAPGRLYTNTPTRPSSAMSLTFGKATWDGLDDAARAVLEAAAKAETHLNNAQSMQGNALAYQALKLTQGAAIEAMPQGTWDAMMEASRAVYESLGDEGGQGRRAFRAYGRFAEAVQNWTRVSEAAFTENRARNVPS